MDENIRDLDLGELNKDEPEIIDETLGREDLPDLNLEDMPMLGTQLRSGSTDGVTFLGYLDEPEEMLPGGKRRCLYGCASSDDVEYLPTETGLSLSNGGKTAAPADWSLALVAGGDTQVLIGGSWGAL
jgi:hypothetical protein